MDGAGRQLVIMSATGTIVDTLRRGDTKFRNLGLVRRYHE